MIYVLFCTLVYNYYAGMCRIAHFAETGTLKGFCPPADWGCELEGPGSNLDSDPWGGRQSPSAVAIPKSKSLTFRILVLNFSFWTSPTPFSKILHLNFSDIGLVEIHTDLLKHIFHLLPCLGVQSHFCGLAHSASEPFNSILQHLKRERFLLQVYVELIPSNSSQTRKWSRI